MTSPALSATRASSSRWSTSLRLLESSNSGPSGGGAAADVRPQRHLTQAASELVEFGFLDGDLRLGVDDLRIELRLGVDGFDVVLGELVGLLLEAIEFVDDLLDLLALPVDRLGRGDRRGHRGNQERDHQGDAGTRGEAAS